MERRPGLAERGVPQVLAGTECATCWGGSPWSRELCANAVHVRFEASSLGNFKQGDNRQLIHGKLISNRAQNCLPVTSISCLLTGSIYFLNIPNIYYIRGSHTLNSSKIRELYISIASILTVSLFIYFTLK